MFSKAMKAMQKRGERKARIRSGEMRFNTHQLMNVARFDQKIILMGK